MFYSICVFAGHTQKRIYFVFVIFCGFGHLDSKQSMLNVIVRLYFAWQGFYNRWLAVRGKVWVQDVGGAAQPECKPVSEM